MKKFLLVDDHIVMRTGIRWLLSEIFKQSEIHEAADNDDIFKKIKNHRYDLIVMDIKVHQTDMLGLMEFFHHAYPYINVLVFSMYPEHIYASRFIKAGARGYLSKNAPVEEMITAINLIVNGGRYINESYPNVPFNFPD